VKLLARRSRSLCFTAAALASLVGGCTPVDVQFGEAQRWNIEQQVINLEPVYAGDVQEGASGERAVSASDRLETGRVRQPVSASTTTSATEGQSGAPSPSPVPQ
jgi:hypothetical protein